MFFLIYPFIFKLLDESSQTFIENPLEFDEVSQIFTENPLKLPLYYQVGSGFEVSIKTFFLFYIKILLSLLLSLLLLKLFIIIFRIEQALLALDLRT